MRMMNSRVRESLGSARSCARAPFSSELYVNSNFFGGPRTANSASAALDELCNAVVGPPTRDRAGVQSTTGKLSSSNPISVRWSCHSWCFYMNAYSCNIAVVGWYQQMTWIGERSREDSMYLKGINSPNSKPPANVASSTHEVHAVVIDMTPPINSPSWFHQTVHGCIVATGDSININLQTNYASTPSIMGTSISIECMAQIDGHHILHSARRFRSALHPTPA
ncbi:uncharacterized protein EI90DRAFT_3013529 [Cantharellus anzutake]|uniref:uncharacterized protein n=1 Tax=Cantharellus anzutake TaxID=1750568 RepID=UPI001903F8C8|nr:uncharacterized protein EI90DRAFT_3013529 [Cantharellus anzutake]KAF8338263.1 hypothetical protein EI90DRAFT_3013529 [Cantharellus anzutake]